MVRQGSGKPPGSPLGGLVGAGPSRVGVSGAMRARDVSRPREAEDPQDGDEGSGGSEPEDS